MKSSPLLEFESTAFPIEKGEDEETNPGIYGKALAQWLAERIRATGFPTGEVFAEDYGWCMRVESKPHRFYIACASVQDKTDQWQVYASAEAGVVARLLGKGKSVESLADLHTAVRRCLESAPFIHSLREQST